MLTKWKPWQLAAEYDLVKRSHGQGQLSRRLVVNTLTPPSGSVLVETEPAWERDDWAWGICNSEGRRLWMSHPNKMVVAPFAADDGQCRLVTRGDLRNALLRVMEEDREMVRVAPLDFCPTCCQRSTFFELNEVDGWCETCGAVVHSRHRLFFLLTQEPERVLATGLFDAPCRVCNGSGREPASDGWGPAKCRHCGGSCVRRLENVVLTLPAGATTPGTELNDLAQHFAGVAVYRTDLGVVEYRGETLEVK